MCVPSCCPNDEKWFKLIEVTENGIWAYVHGRKTFISKAIIESHWKHQIKADRSEPEYLKTLGKIFRDG